MRLAVAKLIGPQKRAGDGLTVDLAVVEQALRRSLWPPGLVDAVVTLTGDVPNRRAVAQAEAEAWGVAAAAFAPAIGAHPELAEWFDAYLARGDLKRLARVEARRSGHFAKAQTALTSASLAEIAAHLAASAAHVLVHLPSNGELRSVFARRVMGDAHSLDYAMPLTSIVLAAVGVINCDILPGKPDQRQLWESAGVIVSGLASNALCLGVGAVPGAAETGGMTAATASCLETARLVPMVVTLTLDQVLSDAVQPMGPAGTVYACENIAVIEAAATALRERGIGPSSNSCLVCLAGQPTVAVARLLARLTADGATVRYHGDFDWAGLRIASNLSTIAPWEPWRFGATDYESATEAARQTPNPVRLKGAPASAEWDDALVPAMKSCGLAVEEEAVIDDLVGDVVAAWS